MRRYFILWACLLLIGVIRISILNEPICDLGRNVSQERLIVFMYLLIMSLIPPFGVWTNERKEISKSGRAKKAILVFFICIFVGGTATGLVLVYGSSRRACVARMIADMNEIRATAEDYRTTQNNYTEFCDDSRVISFRDDILDTTPSEKFDCNVSDDGQAYCAEVQLGSGWWCVDSALRSKQYPTNPICGQESVYSCE